MTRSILCFDIETIPDVEGIKKLGLVPSGLSDEDVVAHITKDRLENGKSEFLPHYLQRVWVIGCLFKDDRGLKISCIEPSNSDSTLEEAGLVKLGSVNDLDEESRIKKFFNIIEKYSPTIISWNGKGFDIPVLNYRAIVYGLSAPRFWDQGESNRDNKFNNYINRYHRKHLDLMDILSNFSSRSFASLDHMARLSGFPGKLGEEGSNVWNQFLSGKEKEVKAYCETDVVNTYLMYLKYLKLTGSVSNEEYQDLISEIKNFIANLLKKPEDLNQTKHWKKFLNQWQESG